MAIKTLNSVGGFSVKDTTGNISVVIDGSGNIFAANLTVAGESNLGSNANVVITGGSSGQYLRTDGAGNLTWASVGSGSGILYIISRSGAIPISITGGILTIVGRSGNVNVPVA